jgi:hypothetical protein
LLNLRQGLHARILLRLRQRHLLLALQLQAQLLLLLAQLLFAQIGRELSRLSSGWRCNRRPHLRRDNCWLTAPSLH